MRTLIDDVNKAKMATLEYQMKELEYQNMPKEQKLELEKLKNDIKLGNISAAQAGEQIKLLKDKFEYEKEQNKAEKEIPPTKSEMLTSLKTVLDAKGTDVERLAYIKSISADIISFLGKSVYDAYVAQFGG
jgi:Skp family chaperone for outer membrane proteins